MATLEALARTAWERWGAQWAKHTICFVCGEAHYCRSKNGKKYICVDCFDQGHVK